MPTLEKNPKSKKLVVRPVAELVQLPPNAIITLQEVAALARLSLRFVSAARSEGKGPRVLSFGRSIRVRLSDATDWINSRAGSTPA